MTVRSRKLRRSLASFWTPLLAVVVVVVAVLADLYIEPFRTFATAHPMITALVSMAVFALLTAWIVEALAVRRERGKRSSVTANAVRVTASMGWGVVGHVGLGWPNLRNGQVLSDVQRSIYDYESQVAILALTPNADDAFYDLLSAHDRLGAAFESFIQREPASAEQERDTFEQIRALQHEVDEASWPYIRSVLPDYWEDAERFTPPYVEPAPWYLMMPRCPSRQPPQNEARGAATGGRNPKVNLGSEALGKSSDVRDQNDVEFRFNV